MASFMVTLIVDSDYLDEEAVAEVFDQAMYDVAREQGMTVHDFTAYHIYTGRK